VWERLLRVNVMGIVNGCQVFGACMTRAPGHCSIVNVSSAASAAPVPNLGA
jgi:NAD(P)-dependent dehydrogenase (short-subunit alcohol dehydrogenase family)